MGKTRESQVSGPIGVINALFIGFDRVAARPVLILPPLLLDVVLWLGPKARITPILSRAAADVPDLLGTSQMTADQLSILQEGVRIIGERLNLLGALSTFPAGVPSLMTTRMPGDSPVQAPGPLDIGDLWTTSLLWVLLTMIGLGFGGLYHRWIAQQVGGEGQVASGWSAWRRLIALSGLAYIGLFAAITTTLLLASLASLFLPLLGAAIVLTSFSLVFWAAVYLVFTPHAIIRYRLSVLQAISDSALVVRWNTLGTIGFLVTTFAILWVTNRVWLLPEDASWFNLLAIAGHAFVVGVVLVGSYAFYQGRREWLMAHLERRAAEMRRWQDLELKNGNDEEG